MNSNELIRELRTIWQEREAKMASAENEWRSRSKEAADRWAKSSARFKKDDIIMKDNGSSIPTIIKVEEISCGFTGTAYKSNPYVVYRGTELHTDLSASRNVSDGTIRSAVIYDYNDGKVTRLDGQYYVHYVVVSDTDKKKTDIYMEALKRFRDLCISHRDAAVYGVKATGEQMEMHMNHHLERYIR